VVVAVYGPIEVKHRDEILDRATIKVHWSPSSGTGGTFSLSSTTPDSQPLHVHETRGS
jgi:hypothetical protein